MDNNASVFRLLSSTCTLALLVTLAACVGPGGYSLGSTMGGSGILVITGPQSPFTATSQKADPSAAFRSDREWDFDDTRGVFGGMRLWRGGESPYRMSAGSTVHEYTDGRWSVFVSLPEYAGPGVYADEQVFLSIHSRSALDWDENDVEFGGEELDVVTAAGCTAEVFEDTLTGQAECTEVVLSYDGVTLDGVYTVQVSWASDATPYQEPEFASE